MKCPICLNSNFSTKYEIDKYKIKQCNICDLVLLDKNFSANRIIRFYKDYYSDNSNLDKGYENYELMENALRKNFRHRIKKIVKKTGNNISLLDVGAGYGFFVDECLRMGVRAEGLEISKEAITFAKEKLQIKMHEGSFEDFNAKKRYDVITLWDVIEHIYDPNEFLLKINKILKPNGKVYISTGNIDSLMAKTSKDRWHLFNLPEHLCFYSERTFKKLLMKNGFRDVSIKYPNNYFTLGYILERLLKKTFRVKDARKIQKITNSKFLQAIFVPVNLYDIMELKIVKS